MDLWKMVEELKSDEYEWVELSHVVSPETPHWIGFPAMRLLSKPLDYHEPPYDVVAQEFAIVSQYGTHIDAPKHFVDAGKTLDQIPVKSIMFPLCVVDCSAKVAANPDFELGIADLEEYEASYGRIPENAFVAFRSDWSVTHANDYQNNDAEGNPHYPGWKLEALKWLVEERNVGAFGHETTDTDAPAAGLGWVGELYVLQQDKFQIEVMKDLYKLPAAGALIICTWPRVKDSVGFTARCVGIYKK